MGGGFGPACCCIRAVCRWLVLNDRLWTLFSHLFGEVGLGVGAIASPHPINDPDHPCLRGENLAYQNPCNGRGDHPRVSGENVALTLSRCR